MEDQCLGNAGEGMGREIGGEEKVLTMEGRDAPATLTRSTVWPGAPVLRDPCTHWGLVCVGGAVT